MMTNETTGDNFPLTYLLYSEFPFRQPVSDETLLDPLSIKGRLNCVVSALVSVIVGVATPILLGLKLYQYQDEMVWKSKAALAMDCVAFLVSNLGFSIGKLALSILGLAHPEFGLNYERPDEAMWR